MKTLMFAAALALIASSAQATSCKVNATEKKLAGAALTSFMKKCETDAKATCDTQALEKKLAGAAKTSFVKKCETDSIGN